MFDFQLVGMYELFGYCCHTTLEVHTFLHITNIIPTFAA